MVKWVNVGMSDLSLEAPDVMDDPWCCLSCYSKFTFGDCKTNSRSNSIHCPKCGSANLHPIDDVVQELPEYLGEIGTIN